MPPSYEHVVWKKTSLLHRLMYCAIKLPMLKRIVTTTLKGPFFRENPFVKCCGVEADRDPRAPKQMRTHCLVINKADLAAIHKAATSHGASLLGAVYAAALARNGFFGPNSYYMNHAANAAYAAEAVNEILPCRVAAASTQSLDSSRVRAPAAPLTPPRPSERTFHG